MDWLQQSTQMNGRSFSWAGVKYLMLSVPDILYWSNTYKLRIIFMGHRQTELLSKHEIKNENLLLLPLKRKWTHPNDKDGKVHSSQSGRNHNKRTALVRTVSSCYLARNHKSNIT